MVYINGEQARKALINAHANLGNERDKVDSLNVFPVPDGDTGTNMYLTFTSGVDSIKESDEVHLGKVLKQFSRGLLMGARGNSGVILSQIFRGIALKLEDKESADICSFAEAIINGRDVAYKAVMNPVEGTILTVISDIAKSCADCRNKNIDSLLDLVIASGNKSLENTPNLLPVLKEAGVVDSGGYGLMVIFSGIHSYFHGEIITSQVVSDVFDSATVTNEDTEFGYCTEFIIELDENKLRNNKFSEDKLKQQFSKLGDSLVVVHDEDIVKVHVHTLVPGEALNIGQKYGEFLKLKIENMTVQHNEHYNDQPKVEKSEYAVICVSPGEGISELFRELGATHIIDGGQTMNPSTNDFVELIKSANAKNVLLIPNNSNIIMAASQAKELMDGEGVNVEVIEAKSVSQCQVALSFFNTEADVKTNKEEMEDSYADLKYGEITYAVRDTNMNGVDVKKGEYIAIHNKKIVKSVNDREKALNALLSEMVDDESDIISIIYGEDVDEKDLEKLESMISADFSDLELELNSGKQPIYSYFVSVE